jgi:hypothetical protein
MRNEKRGELTTQQIVILIILIVSFIVVLIFILLLHSDNVGDKQICHNSVVMRGTSVLPSKSLPLDCKTRYICLSKDGTCEKMTNPEIMKVKYKEDVYEVLAKEMSDCWWMFGEGKIDYVGKDFWTSHFYCSICSQIAFDDSMDDVFPSGRFDEGEFYNSYLATEEKGDTDLTYSEYLYGIKDFSQIHSGPFKEIDIDEQYYIMMGIKSNEAGVKWAGGAGALIGLTAAALIFPPGIPAYIVGALIVGAGGTGGYFLGGVFKGDSGNEFLLPTIVEADSEVFDSLDDACDYISTLA